ncbi:addiction module protein [Cyanobium sp. Alchichica 3B3-8F6]|uniref:addiction module protein n=1 Tax=Synechococcales TaxID=1890424 RepID=UPI000B98201B|nr:MULTISPECIES: addiction module protein [Synechococcales]MCP9882348.1 addiction module protein [Cyanobium sp. Alchichica 3B3-8F6]MCP9943259.1 addiction module protein [Cyanobium sp. ATX 6E8]
MTPLLKRLEEQARTLCPEDRARLAEVMLESLHSSTNEIDSAWQDEVAHRLDAVDRGLMPTHSADDVFAEASAILR